MHSRAGGGGGRRRLQGKEVPVLGGGGHPALLRVSFHHLYSFLLQWPRQPRKPLNLKSEAHPSSAPLFLVTPSYQQSPLELDLWSLSNLSPRLHLPVIAFPVSASAELLPYLKCLPLSLSSLCIVSSYGLHSTCTFCRTSPPLGSLRALCTERKTALLTPHGAVIIHLVSRQ